MASDEERMVKDILRRLGIEMGEPEAQQVSADGEDGPIMCTEDMDGHIETVLEALQIPPGGNVCDMTHTALLVVARMLELAFGHSSQGQDIDELAHPWVERTLGARARYLKARKEQQEALEEEQMQAAVRETKGQLLN